MKKTKTKMKFYAIFEICVTSWNERRPDEAHLKK